MCALHTCFSRAGLLELRRCPGPTRRASSPSIFPAYSHTSPRLVADEISCGSLSLARAALEPAFVAGFPATATLVLSRDAAREVQAADFGVLGILVTFALLGCLPNDSLFPPASRMQTDRTQLDAACIKSIRRGFVTVEELRHSTRRTATKSSTRRTRTKSTQYMPRATAVGYARCKEPNNNIEKHNFNNNNNNKLRAYATRGSMAGLHKIVQRLPDLQTDRSKPHRSDGRTQVYPLYVAAEHRSKATTTTTNTPTGRSALP